MMTFLRIFSPARWAMLAGTVALLIIAVLALSWCSEKRRADEAGANATMGDARTGAARDAGAIRDKHDEATAAVKAEVKDATDELRQAIPADRDRLFRDRVCRLDPTACPR